MRMPKDKEDFRKLAEEEANACHAPLKNGQKVIALLFIVFAAIVMFLIHG